MSKHEHTRACYREIRKFTCTKKDHKHSISCRDIHGNRRPECPGKEHKHSNEKGSCFSFDSYACSEL